MICCHACESLFWEADFVEPSGRIKEGDEPSEDGSYESMPYYEEEEYLEEESSEEESPKEKSSDEGIDRSILKLNPGTDNKVPRNTNNVSDAEMEDETDTSCLTSYKLCLQLECLQKVIRDIGNIDDSPYEIRSDPYKDYSRNAKIDV